MDAESDSRIGLSTRVDAESSSRRLDQLDALRGIALLGILLVNIFVFHAPYPHYTEFYGPFDGLNGAVLSCVLFVFADKSMFLYAFLFGYSFWLQKEKAINETRFRSYWTRRMLTLAAFGVGHVALIFFGDILLPYAVLGLLLPYVARLRTAGVVLIALIINLVPLYEFMLRGVIDYPSIFMQPTETLDGYIQTNRHGSYWEVMSLRFRDYASFGTEKSIRYIPKEFSLFLTGMVMARMRFASNPRSKISIPVCLLLLVIVIAVHNFRTELISAFDLQNSLAARTVVGFILHTADVAHGMLYVIAFFVLWSLPPFRRCVIAFTYPGRLSLTNYLTQSIVCVLLFSGLGFYSQLNPIELVLVAITLFASQWLFSFAWLKRYPQGPLEMLWRWSAGRSASLSTHATPTASLSRGESHSIANTH